MAAVEVYEPSDKTPADWAQRINASWRNTLDAVFQTGEWLLEAKGTLPHGEFADMVDKQLAFGDRTARMLMTIVKDARLVNRKHVSVLPPSWGTLYALTQLEDAQFSHGIEAEIIRPDMERKHVAPLRQWSGDKPAEPIVEGSETDFARVVESGHKFGTIYADPPWKYGNQGTRAATDRHYRTMTVDEIVAMPVAEVAADNAHLHMWTTNAFLFDSKAIIEAWGFEYKSCFVWAKPNIGIGNYWRVSHEFLLLGIRGSAPFQDRSQRSWLECNRSQHSEKPDQVRHIIEKTSPGPRLEMFARREAPGWLVWGDEIEPWLFDKSLAEVT